MNRNLDLDLIRTFVAVADSGKRWLERA